MELLQRYEARSSTTLTQDTDQTYRLIYSKSLSHVPPLLQGNLGVGLAGSSMCDPSPLGPADQNSSGETEALLRVEIEAAKGH